MLLCLYECLRIYSICFYLLLIFLFKKCLREVLRRNGTAVDAAIATLFCNGLFSCHSMGVGGGFVMTVYNKEKGTVDTLDARETAPAAATVNMFHGNPSASTKGLSNFISDTTFCHILSHFVKKVPPLHPYNNRDKYKISAFLQGKLTPATIITPVNQA